jgi:hypothetical protein
MAVPDIVIFAISAVATRAVQVPVRGYGSALMLLPSTLLHELSHFIVALLTRSKPSGLDLVPRRLGESWTLGSVLFVPGVFSAAFVALAPLSLWALTFYLATWAVGQSWPEQVVSGMLFSTLVQGGCPSRVDLAVALRYPGGLILLAGILGLLFL